MLFHIIMNCHVWDLRIATRAYPLMRVPNIILIIIIEQIIISELRLNIYFLFKLINIDSVHHNNISLNNLF